MPSLPDDSIDAIRPSSSTQVRDHDFKNDTSMEKLDLFCRIYKGVQKGFPPDKICKGIGKSRHYTVGWLSDLARDVCGGSVDLVDCTPAEWNKTEDGTRFYN